MTFAEAAERPFETIMSGPVAGAEGAAELARALRLEYVITADVGGTSFDTCLITDGRPTTLYEGEVVGLPLQTPWVDVRSIGAGGGSIAHVDEGGLLRVGPRSAGAVPGPACYGRGGTRADRHRRRVPARHARRRRARRRRRGSTASAPRRRSRRWPRRSASPSDEVARGILTIANANMADAIREITVEQGVDPRSAVLMPFGGAGPLFRSLLARRARHRRDRAAAVRRQLLRLGPARRRPHADGRAHAHHAARRRRARRRQRASSTSSSREVERRAAHAGAPGSARETRARHALRRPGAHADRAAPATSSGRIAATPERAARALPGGVRAHLRPADGRGGRDRVAARDDPHAAAAPRRRARRASHGAGHAAAATHRRGLVVRRRRLAEFAVVERDALAVGASIDGPAILLEETATTYLDAGFAAACTLRRIILTRGGQA